MSAPNPVAVRRVPRDANAVRERILEAFAERARTRGIRAVVMGDLARSLGMSKKTLYQHFESKDEMVREIVERWIRRMRASAGDPSAPSDPHQLLRWWTDEWVRAQTDYCTEFWRDLERDHPIAWQHFQTIKDVAAPIHAKVSPLLRKEIDWNVAGEMYYLIVSFFNDPTVCQRFNLERRAAVLAALEIWMAGALEPPRA